MQRVITALVQNRQRRLKKKYKPLNTRTTGNRNTPPTQATQGQSVNPPKGPTTGILRSPTSNTPNRSRRVTFQTTPQQTNLCQIPCSSARCKLASVSGLAPGSYRPPKRKCQQCYRFDRTLRIAADIEAALTQSREAREHLAARIAQGNITTRDLLRTLQDHILTRTAITNHTTISNFDKSTGDMLKLAIARVGTTLNISEAHTPFTDPYTTNPITTRCTCASRDTDTCTNCNFKYRLMHQSSNIRWTNTCQNPSTAARDDNMEQVYHPPTAVITHPFHAPSQADVQCNEALCLQPPKRLSNEYPRCNITPAEIKRLQPAFPYTEDQWMNDAIINTMLTLMHMCSPYRTERHFTTTYFTLQAQQDPSNTAKFFNNGARRQNRYKPPPRAPLLLMPFGTGGHWYLLIRTRHRYVSIDSHVDGATKISPTKKAHREAIRNTPAHWVHKRGAQHFDPLKGFIQQDHHNCGVFLLIHAYVYLFHP